MLQTQPLILTWFFFYLFFYLFLGFSGSFFSSHVFMKVFTFDASIFSGVTKAIHVSLVNTFHQNKRSHRMSTPLFTILLRIHFIASHPDHNALRILKSPFSGVVNTQLFFCLLLPLITDKMPSSHTTHIDNKITSREEK